jgi:hypothetical protein
MDETDIPLAAAAPIPHLDDWLAEPGRSATFQAFLDSLESKSARRAREEAEIRKLSETWATKRFLI